MAPADEGAIVYKICGRADWAAAQAAGLYDGAPIDREDGYIHFSAADQVAETAAKHFAGQENLVLLAVPAGRLGDGLRWEPSRGGALFPHLYGGPLPVAAVAAVHDLPLGPDGAHIFPDPL